MPGGDSALPPASVLGGLSTQPVASANASAREGEGGLKVRVKDWRTMEAGRKMSESAKDTFAWVSKYCDRTKN